METLGRLRFVRYKFVILNSDNFLVHRLSQTWLFALLYRKLQIRRIKDERIAYVFTLRLISGFTCISLYFKVHDLQEKFCEVWVYQNK